MEVLNKADSKFLEYISNIFIESEKEINDIFLNCISLTYSCYKNFKNLVKLNRLNKFGILTREEDNIVVYQFKTCLKSDFIIKYRQHDLDSLCKLFSQEEKVIFEKLKEERINVNQFFNKFDIKSFLENSKVKLPTENVLEIMSYLEPDLKKIRLIPTESLPIDDEKDIINSNGCINEALKSFVGNQYCSEYKQYFKIIDSCIYICRLDGYTIFYDEDNKCPETMIFI